jgi:putative restriction endonuclease
MATTRLYQRRYASLSAGADASRCPYPSPASDELGRLIEENRVQRERHVNICRVTLLGDDFDARLRRAAFAFLDGLDPTRPLSHADLASFTFDGTSIRLMATQQGIWKPRQLGAALSVRTVFAADPNARPYADDVGGDGYLRYKWRGEDPNQSENRALRQAMQRQLPLIWFLGVAPALYLATYPVYLAAEEPESHQFVVAVDEESLSLRRDFFDADPTTVRSYAERVVKVRLHQRVFRARVLIAYDNRCAVCRLQHRELLDAAHVLADSAGGEPVITNGIAMCAIHHAAYDANIFSISSEYRIGVRPDVMEESDGPTLRFALQAINTTSISLPRERRARPDTALLDRRWQQFLAAS